MLFSLVNVDEIRYFITFARLIQALMILGHWRGDVSHV